MIFCDVCGKEMKGGKVGVCPDCGRLICEECMRNEDKEKKNK